MTNVIASEWLKVRSVRSTYVLFGALTLLLLACAGIALAMTLDWDGAPPEEQRTFVGADVSMLVMTFAPFLLGTLAALAATSEYATGMIRNSLIAAPRRGTMLAAKSVVVGGGLLVAGQVISFLSWLATTLIVGDRPKPIAPWDTPSDGLPLMFAQGLQVAVVGLVGLGLGLLIRATAGALCALAGLLFVLPVMILMLPPGIAGTLSPLMLPSLPPQLAGEPGSTLSPAAAALVLAAYAVAALAAGGYAFHRRDA